MKYKGIFSVCVTVCAAFVLQAELWAADPPDRCIGNADLRSISLTDWEGGLGSWIADTADVARPETFDTPDWKTVGSLPNGRSGSAAFVANLDAGNCSTDDESGVLTLTSPEIAIAEDAEGPQISFNHWFETEYGYDGGNLKISVNGGSFALVPASAFEFGPYNDTLFPPVDEFGVADNTNPLAGQNAFTGPEDEGTTGSWGESRINLLGIAGPGDTIRLRFDFGVDACFGAVGWYVDEVEVYSCGEGQPPDNPSLTLVNEVINDHGGTATPSAWILTATGPTGFSGPGPSVSSGRDFEAGTYDLSTSGGPAGYAADAWTCAGGNQTDADTITLEAGDEATCTITNDDIAPTLRLVKTIVNDHGGSVTNPNDFKLRIDGNQVANNSTYTVAAGPHLVSEDGLPGYLPGAWGGDCSADGSITLVLGQSATCTITNDDIDPGFRINAGHSGAWYNPETSGQGVLVDISPDEQFMFLAWFTYTEADSADPFEQRWLTAQGTYAGRVAHLTLNETLGGKFDDPQEVNTEPVGEVMLEFDDCEQGRLTYLFDTDDLQGEIPLIRVIPGSDNVCAAQTGSSLQTVDINAGMDGAWYELDTTGQGFLFDVHHDPDGGNFIFVAWFTYGDDTASGQRWLTAQGGFEGPTAVIDVWETTGGSFDDPTPVTRELIGELSIDFTDCSNAILTYSLNTAQLEGEIDISRLLAGGKALCEEIAEAK
jgi:hypothetical protein